jgi:hypothetical protein
MSDQENQNTPPEGQNADGKQTTPDPQAPSPEVLEKFVEEKLKPIKEKLDGAFSQRDEALRKVAEFEAKEREREIASLKEQGKLKEAFEMQLAEKDAKLSTLEKQNIELSRDSDVRAVLSGIEFRNEKANDMAFQEIVSQLVRNERGEWVHKSGVPIRDFVKQYVDDEANNFLLKSKASSGSGSKGPSDKGPSGGDNKSLFSMTTAEVLKLAREGKLPNQRQP